jgi:hypothetical protein
MEKNDGISRRELIKRSLVVLGAATGGAALLSACDSGGDSGGALSCNDLSGLDEQQKQTRTSLEYVEKTPDPAKTCSNCNFWQAGQPNACGSCTLVQGPINPEGYCKSWVAKA